MKGCFKDGVFTFLCEYGKEKVIFHMISHEKNGKRIGDDSEV